MTVIEAKEGLMLALSDIKEMLVKNNIEVNTKCQFSSMDSDNVDINDAECIFAELEIISDKAEKNLYLGVATCIFENEEKEKYVSSDELIANVASLRQDARNLISELENISKEKNVSTSDAFAEYISNQEESESPEAALGNRIKPVKENNVSNTKFYIAASIVAVGIIILMILIRGL